MCTPVRPLVSQRQFPGRNHIFGEALFYFLRAALGNSLTLFLIQSCVERINCARKRVRRPSLLLQETDNAERGDAEHTDDENDIEERIGFFERDTGGNVKKEDEEEESGNSRRKNAQKL